MAGCSPVLLVGSVPLSSAEDVFVAAASILERRLARIPDGETGARATWIAWQRQSFADVPEFEPVAVKERNYQLFPPYRLKAGADAGSIRFAPLGFAREARASYAVFQRLKRDGRIPSGTRLQICLPTPFAPTYSFVAYEAQEAVYPVYEKALLADLAEIATIVPPEELSVQWDVATEMSIWEELYPVTFPNPKDELVRRLARLGAAVPPGAELAYHLCYGSMNNRHWKEPEDTRKLVEVANRLIAEVPRPIEWIHLPVPVDRDDEAYFRPLRDLKRGPDTALFLGLLHLEDGIAGARRRAAAARRFVGEFGVSAECGLGRRSPDSVPAWLQLHRDVADALAVVEGAAQ
jgi:hypothetical protein